MLNDVSSILVERASPRSKHRLSLHRHRARGMVGAVLRLLLALLLLLPLLSLFVVVVSLSLLVLLLVSVSRLLIRRQVLGNVTVILVFLILLLVLSRWRCVENSILFRKLRTSRDINNTAKLRRENTYRYIRMKSETSELDTREWN